MYVARNSHYLPFCNGKTVIYPHVTRITYCSGGWNYNDRSSRFPVAVWWWMRDGWQLTSVNYKGKDTKRAVEWVMKAWAGIWYTAMMHSTVLTQAYKWAQWNWYERTIDSYSICGRKETCICFFLLVNDMMIHFLLWR